MKFDPTMPTRRKFARDFCAACVDILGPPPDMDWLEAVYMLACRLHGAEERTAGREELLVMARQCVDNAQEPSALWLEKAQAFVETMESLS